MAGEAIGLLPGMRDLTGESAMRVRQASDLLCRFLFANGYKLIDTPLLEDLELFVRKSGGEVGSRIYAFTDPGGRRVSLRPEFTSSVIRHHVSRGDRGGTGRWCYSGPVLRYDLGEGGGYRQFTQVGAEMLGESGVGADAEVTWLAWAGLGELGLKGCQVKVGHLGVLHELLSGYSLSEPAKVFAISNVQALRGDERSVDSLLERAAEIGLLRTSLDSATEAMLNDVGEATTQMLIQAVLRESIASPVGRRTPEQIVSRLLRKVRADDDPGKLRAALELLRELAGTGGDPQAATSSARRLVARRGLSAAPLDELDSLLEGLRERGVDEAQTTIDFGLARGFSYYTGLIFELMLPGDSQVVSIGGGGRYDGLVRALGGAREVPALGFAYNLDRVVECVSPLTGSPGGDANGV